ncbi:MAG: spore gernimation protein [Deltaproteobacteria bacterium CG03_land_8_20_14_0_80_45_14]|nr:MAG: spore gernimation protein [Deltaproteobacteria bacterium CG03_land_8_20_14_0_80_45_14]
MKPKRKRRIPRKGRGGKIFLLLVLIGIGLIILFHQQILKSIKPLFERWSILVERKEVLLYFSDSEGEYLIGEKREILKKKVVKEEAKEVVIELIKGPKGKLIPTLPPRTKLLTLQINDAGVARVNFNPALSKDHPGGSSAEMMTVYSIVNSLALNFPQIKRVQILIDGKPIETIAGHLSLKQPVPLKPDLIKRQ